MIVIQSGKGLKTCKSVTVMTATIRTHIVYPILPLHTTVLHHLLALPVLDRAGFGHDALDRLSRSKIRGLIVSNASQLRNDLGSKEIATDVDQRAEAVDEPVDGDDNCVHASNRNADRLGDDEREYQ
jgi:hypothetical protein